MGIGKSPQWPIVVTFVVLFLYDDHQRDHPKRLFKERDDDEEGTTKVTHRMGTIRVIEMAENTPKNSSDNALTVSEEHLQHTREDNVKKATHEVHHDDDRETAADADDDGKMASQPVSLLLPRWPHVYHVPLSLTL